MQPRVLPDAHYGREAQRSLINGLDEVGGNHDNQDALVNHAAETAAFLVGNVYGLIVNVLGQLLVDLFVPLMHALLEAGVGGVRPFNLGEVVLLDPVVVGRSRHADEIGVGLLEVGHGAVCIR